jgi:hypothetical protein
MDSSGQTLQTVALGESCSPGSLVSSPLVFDGNNVLVPVYDGLVALRAADGLQVGHVPLVSPPYALAFDGERLLVLCDGYFQSPDSIALIRAADLTILRAEPYNEGFGSLLFNSLASDGLSFWISATKGAGFALARY